MIACRFCLPLLVVLAQISACDQGWTPIDRGSLAGADGFTPGLDGFIEAADGAMTDDGGTGTDAGTPDAAGPACTAATCAGCCVNDTCQPGTASSACGKAAIACAVCGSLDSCLPDRSCGLAPDKQWTLTIVDAKIWNVCWDSPCGYPDPYLVLNGGYLGYTEDNTYYPYWDVSLTRTTSSLLSGVDRLEVYDEDISVDDWIAGPRYLQFTEADLRKGSAEWKIWDGVNLIRFTFVPR